MVEIDIHRLKDLAVLLHRMKDKVLKNYEASQEFKNDIILDLAHVSEIIDKITKLKEEK